MTLKRENKIFIDVQDDATRCSYKSGDFEIGLKVSNKILVNLYERLEKTWQK